MWLCSNTIIAQAFILCLYFFLQSIQPKNGSAKALGESFHVCAVSLQYQDKEGTGGTCVSAGAAVAPLPPAAAPAPPRAPPLPPIALRFCSARYGQRPWAASSVGPTGMRSGGPSRGVGGFWRPSLAACGPPGAVGRPAAPVSLRYLLAALQGRLATPGPLSALLDPAGRPPSNLRCVRASAIA